MAEKFPKPSQNDPDKIDYYEIEAQVQMLKAKQRKEEGKEYLDKMNQYDQYVKETFAPKVS